LECDFVLFRIYRIEDPKDSGARVRRVVIVVVVVVVLVIIVVVVELVVVVIVFALVILVVEDRISPCCKSTSCQRQPFPDTATDHVFL